MKKLNNYDNTVKNLPRHIHEKFDISTYFPKRDQIDNRNMSLGHAAGTAGRAFLYAASAKKEDMPSMFNSSMGVVKSQSNKKTKPNFNKLDFKVKSGQFIKEWNHFDSNINNTIVEQRKILHQKNYELDSRAWGLKDFGAQPFFGKEIAKQREINEIMLNQTKGKSPDERVPDFKKRFTPISTYMKSLKDS